MPKIGKKPKEELAAQGRLTVRISDEMRMRCRKLALEKRTSMNAIIEEAIEQFLKSIDGCTVS